jgi:hypothetical protein
MIIWSARPQRGPLAPLGNYQVKIRIGAVQKTETFEIRIDPNLEEITSADLQLQFDLAMQIRNQTSLANEAVIQIRFLRNQLEALMKHQELSALNNSVQEIIQKTQSIEESLYQVKNQSNQDPLNFPIKLNNRLASLRRSVENGQARPTDAAYVVFDELKGALKQLLIQLDTLLSEDLNRLNDAFMAQGFKAIEIKKAP